MISRSARLQSVRILALLVAAIVLSACGGLPVSEPSGPAAAKIDASRLKPIVEAELRGEMPASVQRQLNDVPPLGVGQAVPGYPQGLPPSKADMFHFTPEDIAKLKEGHYTAAIAMHLMNDAWPQLQVAGITDELKRFGIKVVATTDANFNAATQINQVGTLVARRPNLMFSIPVNPTTEGPTFRQVTASGIKLVLLDGVPQGLVPGKDFVTVVSANNRGNAQFATSQLVKALGGRGEVGHLGIGYYFFSASIRDERAMSVLQGQPSMKIDRGSFSEPTKAAYNTASGMLLAHPDMQATWAAWDTVAQQVVAAERAQNRKIYIATVDLGAISGLLVAQGYIHAIGAQQPYNQGVTEADAAAYALLGKQVPPYLELPTVPVTIETLLPAYKIVLHTDPPPALVTALKRTAGIEPQV